MQKPFLSTVSARIARWAPYCTLAIASRCSLSTEVSRGTKYFGYLIDLFVNVNTFEDFSLMKFRSGKVAVLSLVSLYKIRSFRKLSLERLMDEMKYLKSK